MIAGITYTIMRKKKGVQIMYDILMNLLYNGLDKQMELCKVEMAYATTTDEVLKLTIKYAKLLALKNEERKNSITWKDGFNAVVNFVGMAAVLNFEQTNIITSKVWGMVSSKFK